MTQPNPILIPELVDQFVAHLVDSRADLVLEACALVSKSWVFAAQHHFFREIVLDSEHLCRAIDKTLRASSHLIQHIRRPRIRRSHEAILSVESLARICRIPFTNLNKLSIETYAPWPTPASQSPGPLGQLLSLPTLQHVKLDTETLEPAIFLPLWETCSPNIRRLHLSCQLTSSDPISPFRRRSSAKLSLESLRLDDAGTHVHEWMAHDFCPFDFSTLAVLSVGNSTSILGCDAMEPALRTIEVLEFAATHWV
jgi:hypothetical protein